MKETVERMEMEVENLKIENEKLNANVNELNTSVANLQDIEQTLEAVRKLEGASLDQLEEQLPRRFMIPCKKILNPASSRI